MMPAEAAPVVDPTSSRVAAVAATAAAGRAPIDDADAPTPSGAGRSRWTLDAATLAAYHADGLVKAPQRIDAALLADMREALDRLLRDNAALAPESLVCPHIPNGSTHGPMQAARWLGYARHPGLLDLVSQILGPDLILWGSQVFCKPPRTGRALPWHQDGQYWPIRPLATCSVWLALDDATPANGCMRFIPGSHRGRRLHAHRHVERPDVVLYEETEPAAFDASTARDDVLEAGEFSLHDVHLIHGSAPNRSDTRRAGFVLRYMPATSRFARDLGMTQIQAGASFSFMRRPIWLVRGVDRAGNDFAIGHGEDYGLAPRTSDDL
jgi:hypothetical protein